MGNQKQTELSFSSFRDPKIFKYISKNSYSMHTKLVLNFVFVLLISSLLLNVFTKNAKNEKLIPLLSQPKLNNSKVESALKSTSRKLLTHPPNMKIRQLLRKSVEAQKNTIRLRKRVTKRLLKKIKHM